MLLKKMVDFSSALWKSLRIKLKRKPEMLIAFANTSAAISVILSKLLNIPMMIYSYEPHSEFLADFGIWQKSGLRYKMLKHLENKAAQQSRFVLTGTQHMVDDLKNKISGKVIWAPSAVDDNIFKFSQTSRDELRIKHQLEGKKILIYVGKFGGIYYDEEIIDFSAALCGHDPDWHVVILSPEDKDHLSSRFEKKLKGQYLIEEAFTPQEVASWLSLADIGLNAIPPLPSQKYRSPVKVGEYLLCGLPYITCRNVSEDDIWATKHEVGIVVDDLSTQSGSSVKTDVDQLLNTQNLREKCRKVGQDYRSIQRVHQAFELALNKEQ